MGSQHHLHPAPFLDELLDVVDVGTRRIADQETGVEVDHLDAVSLHLRRGVPDSFHSELSSSPGMPGWYFPSTAARWWGLPSRTIGVPHIGHRSSKHETPGRCTTVAPHLGQTHAPRGPMPKPSGRIMVTPFSLGPSVIESSSPRLLVRTRWSGLAIARRAERRQKTQMKYLQEQCPIISALTKRMAALRRRSL